jgi:hypothetical protein
MVIIRRTAQLMAGALLLAWCSGAASATRPVGKTVRVYNGAIAFHRASLSYGYAIDRNTAREAQLEALKQCGHTNCEIVARLRNDCGAVANGKTRFAIGKGATREEAETKALRACGAGCEPVVWACTR